MDGRSYRVLRRVLGLVPSTSAPPSLDLVAHSSGFPGVANVLSGELLNCRKTRQSPMQEPATTSLRAVRVQRGFTVEALAVLADVHKSTVSRVERGLVEPGPETVVAIARALGVSASRAQRLTRGRPSIVLPNGSADGGPP